VTPTRSRAGHGHDRPPTDGGSRDNRPLEGRADVLTFTTGQLDAPLAVAGVPSVRLFLGADNPHCDVFARLCDVDATGVSRNLTDQIVRLTPDRITPGQVAEVAMDLTDLSHVFGAGHRIRLQVSVGAHPRFARNLGTADNPAFTASVATVTRDVLHEADHPSALVLTVLPG
jgi:putative CocE/NonD family hydrolase